MLGGAGGYNTREVIELARELERIGVDGILSVTPYYNKPTQEGLYQHYKAIAEAVDAAHRGLQRAGTHGRERGAGYAGAAGGDREHRGREGSLRQHLRRWPTILHEVPADFTVLSGDDAITIPLMALGGRGIISVVSNEIPREMTRAGAGLPAAAISQRRAPIQPRYLPLMNVNFVESNPIPVKAAMGLMGLLEPVYRLPMVPPSAANLAEDRKGAGSRRPAGERARLQAEIEALFDEKPAAYTDAHFALFAAFQERAERRAASAPPSRTPHRATGWRVNAWVKKGILLGFRMGGVDRYVGRASCRSCDKYTYPMKQFDAASGVRIVPGGSSIRDGCYIGKGVTCMPPMYINAGAYVDDGTMIDSHALVGSCAQVGKNCHISAASQIGGVLEPVGALPVIVEDDVLVGGNCGIYEGTVVKRRAVLGTGTILNRSTPVYDLVRDTVHRATDERAAGDSRRSRDRGRRARRSPAARARTGAFRSTRR